MQDARAGTRFKPVWSLLPPTGGNNAAAGHVHLAAVAGGEPSSINTPAPEEFFCAASKHCYIAQVCYQPDYHNQYISLFYCVNCCKCNKITSVLACWILGLVVAMCRSHTVTFGIIFAFRSSLFSVGKRQDCVGVEQDV